MIHRPTSGVVTLAEEPYRSGHSIVPRLIVSQDAGPMHGLKKSGLAKSTASAEFAGWPRARSVLWIGYGEVDEDVLEHDEDAVSRDSNEACNSVDVAI